MRGARAPQPVAAPATVPDPVSGEQVSPAVLAARTHEREMARQGLKPDGSPLDPVLSSITKDDGTMKDAYQLKGEADVTVNKDGYNKIKELAMRDPSQQSAWARMATEKAGLEEQNSIEAARRQGAGLEAQQMNRWMMQGGASQGARAGMAKANLRAQLMNQQDIGRQGQLTRMDISAKDEDNRIDMVKNLTDLDAQLADLDLKNRSYKTGVNEFNLKNQLQEVDAKRAFDQNIYGEKMKKWAADRTATAQASSGGGK